MTWPVDSVTVVVETQEFDFSFDKSALVRELNQPDEPVYEDVVLPSYSLWTDEVYGSLVLVPPGQLVGQDCNHTLPQVQLVVDAVANSTRCFDVLDWSFVKGVTHIPPTCTGDELGGSACLSDLMSKGTEDSTVAVSNAILLGPPSAITATGDSVTIHNVTSWDDLVFFTRNTTCAFKSCSEKLFGCVSGVHTTVFADCGTFGSYTHFQTLPDSFRPMAKRHIGEGLSFAYSQLSQASDKVVYKIPNGAVVTQAQNRRRCVAFCGSDRSKKVAALTSSALQVQAKFNSIVIGAFRDVTTMVKAAYLESGAGISMLSQQSMAHGRAIHNLAQETAFISQTVELLTNATTRVIGDVVDAVTLLRKDLNRFGRELGLEPLSNAFDATGYAGLDGALLATLADEGYVPWNDGACAHCGVSPRRNVYGDTMFLFWRPSAGVFQASVLQSKGCICSAGGTGCSVPSGDRYTISNSTHFRLVSGSDFSQVTEVKHAFPLWDGGGSDWFPIEPDKRGLVMYPTFNGTCPRQHFFDEALCMLYNMITLTVFLDGTSSIQENGFHFFGDVKQVQVADGTMSTYTCRQRRSTVGEPSFLVDLGEIGASLVSVSNKLPYQRVAVGSSVHFSDFVTVPVGLPSIDALAAKVQNDIEQLVATNSEFADKVKDLQDFSNSPTHLTGPTGLAIGSSALVIVLVLIGLIFFLGRK